MPALISAFSLIFNSLHYPFAYEIGLLRFTLHQIIAPMNRSGEIIELGADVSQNPHFWWRNRRWENEIQEEHDSDEERGRGGEKMDASDERRVRNEVRRELFHEFEIRNSLAPQLKRLPSRTFSFSVIHICPTTPTLWKHLLIQSTLNFVFISLH